MATGSKNKKHLLEKITNLSSTEHEEIFNIIKRLSETDPSVTFTSNKNGVFFNLSGLSDEVVNEIDRFVQFCYSNKEDLDEYDKKLSECKASSNIINIDLEHIVEKKQTSGSKMASALPIVDWSPTQIDQTVEAKTAQKIANFIEKMTCDKTSKKKINVKFHNAKKKYGKKVTSDAKFDCEYLGDLDKETYPVILKA